METVAEMMVLMVILVAEVTFEECVSVVT